MAGMARQSNAAPSPNSSEEIDSQHATPATKISTFSPDETLELSSTGSRGIIRSKIPPAFDLTINTSSRRGVTSQENTSAYGYQDPFVTSSSLGSATTKSSADASKLSPAATSFTPASSYHSSSGLEQFGTAGPTSSVKGSDRDVTDLNVTAASLAYKNSQPGQLPERVGSAAQTRGSSSLEKPLATATVSESRVKNVPTALGPFSSEDGTSRALMLQLGPESAPEQLDEHFNSMLYPSLLAIVICDLSVRGIVYIKFCDIRDADKAFSFIQNHLPGWKVQHISPVTFSWKHQPETAGQSQLSNNEGQIAATTRYIGNSQHYDTKQIACDVKAALEGFGQIMAFSMAASEFHVLVFRVEFYDINSANDVLLQKGRLEVPNCSVSLNRFESDNSSSRQNPPKISGPIIIGQDDTHLDSQFSRMTLASPRDPNVFQTPRQPPYQPSAQGESLTGRKVAGGQHIPSPLNSLSQDYGAPMSLYSPTWTSPANTYNSYGMTSPLWSPYSPGAIGQERNSPSLPVDGRTFHQPQSKALARIGTRQQPDFTTGHHNVVDVDRIRAGLDVRTTIMLRNIPNKIDQAMLKDIVDETSLGKYDFMYLRIDFANNCNVGYAFINFEDPIWIVDFVNARAGHRWNRFNSDKVAEVSYATIQGRDCLIQKFRNSSVMLEHPSFRPKLYCTGTGPLVGSEETFPGPDNPSKMRRSVENAEHIGLFAPRAGQNFRDEQRRRRSQYDRGTRLAELEDSSYEVNNYKLQNTEHGFRAPRPYGLFTEQYPSNCGMPYY